MRFRFFFVMGFTLALMGGIVLTLHGQDARTQAPTGASAVPQQSSPPNTAANRPAVANGDSQAIKPLNQPARLQVDLIQVQCDSETLATLDLDKLTADNVPIAELIKRLPANGNPHLLTRIDTVVDLADSSEITLGKRAPFVQEIRIAKDGTKTPSISYEKIGFIGTFTGAWDAENPEIADLSCLIEFSSGEPSGVGVGGIDLAAFCENKMERSLSVRNGKASWFMCNNLPWPNDPKGLVEVAITRLVVTRIQR